MALYCGTIDVGIFSQVSFGQIGFTTAIAYDAFVQGTLIPKVMDMVDNWVGHNFLSNSGTIRLDGSGKETQHITRIGLVNAGAGLNPPILRPVPMMTITGVNIDSVAQTLTNFQRYDTFVTYEDNIFCHGRQNVDIVGTWGYSTVPHDIQYVTAQISANALNEMIRSRMMPDIIAASLTGSQPMDERGIVSILRSPKVLTLNEKEILNRYRRWEIEIG